MHDAVIQDGQGSFRARYDFWNVNLRLLIFLSVIAVYAVFGEPTPDHFGIPEIFIGTGLFIIVGIKGAAGALRLRFAPRWQQAGVVFLVYGLIVGMIGGVLRDNSLSLMIRDIVPFLFMFLPVFLYGFLQRLDDRKARLLTAAIVMLGVLFALRVIYPVLSGGFGGNLQIISVRDPALLANAPTVLFAAVLLTGLAGYMLTTSASISSIAKVFVLGVLAAAPVMAMAVIQQRASMAYFAAALVFLLGYGLCRCPYRMALPVLLCIGVGAFLMPVLTELWQTLEHKHAMVGLNMRGREAAAVLDAVDNGLWSILFGQGWGATIVSPAVGGDVVNFTHSLLTATWLKTGLVGVFFSLCYLYALVAKLWHVMRVRMLLAAAIAGPFIIDVFLYASYKSLDFGLLLLLIPLWADRPVLLKKQTDCST